jgi:uncharacterized protein DUF6506
MLENRGFIYVQGPGTDPAMDRVVIESAGCRTTIVAVPDQYAGVQVAVELVDSGAQRVELYDSLGPIWIGNAIDAIPGLLSLKRPIVPGTPIGIS